jgi:hypothetical protein
VKKYNKPVEDWLFIKRKLPGYVDVLEDFDEMITHSLVETNVAILRRVCERLGITTKIVLDHPTPLTKGERLVQLCQAHDATTYLSGPSGTKYIDETVFTDAGLKVEYQAKAESRSAIDLLREAS